MKIGISLPVRELKSDMQAIKAFAQMADELGLTHLRVPDQVLRPESGHLHEPLTLLAYIAEVTTKIELVPSVIVLPSRQTVLVAKQAAELDVLSVGRVRNPHAIGTEAGVAVVGPREAEWRERVSGWRRAGLSHLCLRTLGGGLDAQGHLDKMQQVYAELPAD